MPNYAGDALGLEFAWVPQPYLLSRAAGVPSASEFRHFPSRAFADLASVAPRASWRPARLWPTWADPYGEALGAASPVRPLLTQAVLLAVIRGPIALICCLLRPSPADQCATVRQPAP